MKRTFQLLVVCFGGMAVVLILLLLINSTAPVKADFSIRYLAPGGICNGVTPCFGSLQEAIDASASGDEIRVSAGVYAGISSRSGVTQVAYISQTLTIRGGYTINNWLNSDPDTNPTTLDAVDKGRVLYITGDISPTVEALRVTGGNAEKGGGEQGGGVYIYQANAIISNNCIFSNTSKYGSGVYVYDSASTIVGNSIVSNTGEWGGGMALIFSSAKIIGNTIVGNEATIAGGGLGLNDSPATVDANIISANTAAFSGGAMYLNYSDATISGNTMENNTANAVFFWHSDAMFTANTIVGSPGGVFMHSSDALLINNIIADNRYDGVRVDGSSPRLVHNTIAGNNIGVSVTTRWQDGTYYSSTVFLTNTILASNNSGIYVSGGNTVTVSGILWHSTGMTVAQSITALVTVQNQHTGDPSFAADSYRILPTSAAMDNGISAGVDSDIDGHHRPYNATPDLGADEIIAISVLQNTGNILVYTDTLQLTTSVQVPEGAVTDTTTLALTPVANITPPAGYAFAGHAFDLNAYQSGVFLPTFTFSKSVTITIHYAEGDIGILDEETLSLKYWNESASAWEDAASTCTPASNYERHPGDNWFALPICHLSRFGMFGGHRIYLPLVLFND